MDSNLEIELSNYSEFASESSGGRVLFATDDFFAPCEGLIRDQEPVFDAERYTEFGKWMDGWETRRKRIPGHDWCLLALPTLCLVRGLLVDTAFFTGNYAPKFSVQAARLTPKEAELIPKRAGGIGQACSQQDLQQVSRIKSDKWQEIVPRTALRPGYEETRENYLKVVNETPWTHLRVNLFPDGGIARLRVFGEARPELPPADQLIDLASLLNGATCLGFSNAHYGNPKNMIKPSKSLTMADGWETARRLDRPEIIEVNEDGTLQVTGEEWAVFKLGFPGAVSRVCVDTAHFKGNFPDSVKIEGAFLAEKWDVDDNIAWSTIMKSKLSADKEHWFDCKSENITHIRVTMAPDGGISRVRVFGYVKSE